MKVPRPVSGTNQSPGIGKIFIKYDKAESTAKAFRALAGRKFADRTVVTTFFPEVLLPERTFRNVSFLDTDITG